MAPRWSTEFTKGWGWAFSDLQKTSAISICRQGRAEKFQNTEVEYVTLISVDLGDFSKFMLDSVNAFLRYFSFFLNPFSDISALE